MVRLVPSGLAHHHEILFTSSRASPAKAGRADGLCGLCGKVFIPNGVAVKGIRNFIFDVDGTLFDSRRDIAHAQLLTLNELGIAGFSAEDIYPNIGKPMRETFEFLLPVEMHSRIPEAALIYRQHYLAHAFDTTRLFPGVAESLEQLRRCGSLLAVATTKSTQTTTMMLRHFGIEHFFCQIQGTDQTPAKPDPFIINKILIEQGWDRVAAVMVGDTDKDIGAAKNASIQSCGVTYGSFSREQLTALDPTWIIDAFPDILSIVDQV
ncbi:MAG: HAD-IA family hydrolase [Ignavibacteriales bacterium]|nr:HAD-IA family hydrolase [Ignavibacteriales bacterium]